MEGKNILAKTVIQKETQIESRDQEIIIISITTRTIRDQVTQDSIASLDKLKLKNSQKHQHYE